MSNLSTESYIKIQDKYFKPKPPKTEDRGGEVEVGGGGGGGGGEGAGGGAEDKAKGGEAVGVREAKHEDA